MWGTHIQPKVSYLCFISIVFTHMVNSTDGVPTPTTPLCEGVCGTDGGVVGGVQVPLTDHHECQNGSNLACGALTHDQR